MFGLNIDSEISKRYTVCGFIGDKNQQGKGYGTEAFKLIAKYAFEILNAETIYSGVYVFNIASLKACKKAGFKEVGKYRKAYFYKGRYHDEILIEMTKEDYIEENENK